MLENLYSVEQGVYRYYGDGERHVAGLLGDNVRQPLDVVIITDKRAEQFLAEVNRIYVPLKVVRVLSPKRDKAAITKLGYPLKESLYLCSGRRCFASVADPAHVVPELRNYMKELKF